jgi:hypothetical protein
MRIKPVSPPYSEAVQALFNRLPASWSPPFKLFTVLARDERLLLRFTGGAVSYLEPNHVAIRQREVLLLRATARCRCLRMGDEGALLRGRGGSKRSPALRRRVWPTG